LLTSLWSYMKKSDSLKNGPLIFVFRLPPRPSGDELMNAWSILSDKEKTRATQFKRETDKNRFIFSRVFLRKILSRFVKGLPAGLVFGNNKYGRPFLIKPRQNNFDFNLSHSGEWAAVAINAGQVGIDIEKIAPTDQLVAQNYFSAEELDYLRWSKKRKPEAFYEIWTLKESLVKAMGQGLSRSLKQFSFKIIGKQIIFKNNGRTVSSWNFTSRRLAKNYQLAVCWKGSRLQNKDLKVAMLTKL